MYFSFCNLDIHTMKRTVWQNPNCQKAELAPVIQNSCMRVVSIARAQAEPLLQALDLVLLLNPSPASSLLAEIAQISDFRPQNGYLSDLCWGA